MNGIFTLRKACLLAVASAFTLLPSSAQTPKLQRFTQDKVMVNGREVSAIKSCPTASAQKSGKKASALNKKDARKQPKKASSASDTYILIEEDFSKLTAGSVSEPYTDEPIANAYGDPGWDVDPKYLEPEGWSGTFIYQAGGAAALIDPYGYVGACINTPEGDYSGDITISFRVKAIEGYEKSSTLFVDVCKGGTNNPSMADCEDSKYLHQVNILPGKGWQEITFSTRNLSADADGFIQLNCYGHIIIDDLKITSTTNFIAAPHVQGVTEFTDSTFTVAWDPVNAALNYYLMLYKQVYTSDEGLTLSADFEDEALPEGYTLASTEPASFTADRGKDASKGLILHNGDTIYTPDLSAVYKNLNFYMSLVADDYADDVSQLYGTYVKIGAKTLSGWTKLGTFYGVYFMDGYDVDLDESCDGAFADLYQGVYITVSGMPDGAYIVLDNMVVTTDRPYELQEVLDDELSMSGYMYDETDDTQYTFKNLDPEGEYYYNVRSHYMLMHSDMTTLNYAFGVAAPKLLPATDIDARGSYTANWKAAPKATRYQVINYGLTTVDEDGTVTVLDEDFSGVDSNVTTSTDPYAGTSLSNYPASSLDEYTSMPGWTGVYNTLAEGYLGCDYSYYVSSWIKTPLLTLNNGDGCDITINAVGYNGSALVINDGTTNYLAYFEANEDGTTGYIDGTYHLGTTGEAVNLRFYDYSGYPFALDYVSVSQDVKAGARIYTQLEAYEATADETSHTFTGLDQWDFDTFAYSVMSYYDKGDDSVSSEVSRYQLVDLVNGTTTTGVKGTDAANGLVKIEAVYSIDGTQLSAPQKGLNIMKLSDGRTVKQIVK